jgi:hypothetical protein
MTILSFAYNVDTPSNPWAVLENFEMDQKLWPLAEIRGLTNQLFIQGGV